jgi:hypothetical protein
MSDEQPSKTEAFLGQCIQAAAESLGIPVVATGGDSAAYSSCSRVSTQLIQWHRRRSNFDQYDPRQDGELIPVDKPPTQSAE